jgi:lipoprotein-releasing system permease protein
LNFPFYIARRYTVSFSKSTAINIITGIATVGIIVSAMALFVVLSVFSGLREFSLSFANETDPDLKITNAVGKSLLITPEQENQLKHSKNIALYSKTIEERVLFSFKEKQEVAYLKGVDSVFRKTNPFEKKIYAGQWLAPNTSQVVIGYGIANKLSMGLFDFNNPLEVFVPKPGKGPVENPEEAFNETTLIPIGVYAINDELDKKYVFSDLALAQELLQYQPNQITSVELKLKPEVSEEDAIAELKSIFKNKADIKTRTELNSSLHKMLNSENLFIYLFCTLVVILTLFCLAGAIVMIIIDKKDNIHTLYNIGLPILKIRTIFFIQGILITFIGLFFGLLLGSALVLLQENFALIMITDSMAYPISFNGTNILIVILTVIVLGTFSSWIASSRVSKNLFV